MLLAVPVLTAIFFTSTAQTRIEGLALEPAPQLVIFTLRGQGVTTPLVAFQERARSAVETHMHVRVLSMDETLARGGSEFQNSLMECRGEPACLSKLVGKVDANYLLVVTATLLGETRVVGSRLIDLAALSVLGEAVDEVSASGKLLDAVEESIRGSIPAGLWDPFGSLVISVNESGAIVRINGRTVGMSPLKPLGYLTPGAYKIEAEKNGFQVASTSVTIERLKESRATLVLEEVDEGVSWLVWAGLGAVVVAGAVTATAIVLSSGGEDPRFCSATRSELCP